MHWNDSNSERYLARYRHRTEPLDPEIVQDVERALAVR